MTPKQQNPSPELIRKTVERLRALADEARLRILVRLRQGECNVTELVKELGLAQASVSKHLAVLRAAGIVTYRRDKAQSIYRVVDESVFEVCTLVCDSVKRQQAELATALRGADFEL